MMSAFFKEVDYFFRMFDNILNHLFLLSEIINNLHGLYPKMIVIA